jgi:hypothetical protein
MMVNYAPNFTPRARITYTADSVEHKALLRFERDTALWDEAKAVELVEAWRAAMSNVYGLTGLQVGDNRAEASIISAEWADQDSDLFLPLSPTSNEIDAGDDTSGSATPLSKAILLSITGKSTQGKTITLYLWGARVVAGMGSSFSDWRLDSGELSTLEATWASYFDPTVVGCLADLLAGPDGERVSFFRKRLNIRVSATAINAARG